MNHTRTVCVKLYFRFYLTSLTKTFCAAALNFNDKTELTEEIRRLSERNLPINIWPSIILCNSPSWSVQSFRYPWYIKRSMDVNAIVGYKTSNLLLQMRKIIRVLHPEVLLLIVIMRKLIIFRLLYWIYLTSEVKGIP